MISKNKFTSIKAVLIAMLTFTFLNIGTFNIVSVAADTKTKAAQEALKKLGFDPGVPDGAWGNGSRKALNEFQKANGFEETKGLNAGLREALNLAAGGAKLSVLSVEQRIGKTMISAKWRVFYSPDGNKVLKLGNGKTITNKWSKKEDGTYCEFIFTTKQVDCGDNFEKQFVRFNQNETWSYFEKSGKKKFDFQLVEGNKL